MISTLDKLDLEKEAIIDKINGEDVLKRRFLDLGFIPGEVTKCVFVSLGNDPKAYKINGNIIAIRNIDAKNIEVHYERN